MSLILRGRHCSPSGLFGSGGRSWIGLVRGPPRRSNQREGGPLEAIGRV